MLTIAGGILGQAFAFPPRPQLFGEPLHQAAAFPTTSEIRDELSSSDCQ
jgi:hypothetical protein